MTVFTSGSTFPNYAVSPWRQKSRIRKSEVQYDTDVVCHHGEYVAVQTSHSGQGTAIKFDVCFVCLSLTLVRRRLELVDVKRVELMNDFDVIRQFVFVCSHLALSVRQAAATENVKYGNSVKCWVLRLLWA